MHQHFDSLAVGVACKFIDLLYMYTMSCISDSPSFARSADTENDTPINRHASCFIYLYAPNDQHNLSLGGRCGCIH